MTIAGKAGLLSKVGAASALGQSNAPDHPPPCTHQLPTSNSQRPKIQSIYEAFFLENTKQSHKIPPPLAVQDSSIGDVVTQSVSQSVSDVLISLH